MRAPSTWHTSKRTSFTMMSPTKPWKQRRECRKAKPQASRLRFALVWIPAPAEILSGRLDPAERHLRTVGEGKFQPRRLNGGHGTARSTIELSALEAKSAVGQTEVQTAPVTLPPGCAKLGTRPLRTGSNATAKTMAMTVVPLYLFDRKITDANGTDPSLPEQRLHCLRSFFDRYKWIGPMNLIDIEYQSEACKGSSISRMMRARLVLRNTFP